ncbi:MAG: C/D box methylation guide ribonucleoprotein complex aNOP56 subunit [Fervidicoccaceae archaeon]
MKIYLVQHAVGAFAVKEDGSIADYEHETKDIDENVEQLLKYEVGEPTSSMLRLVERLNREDELAVEIEGIARSLSNKFSGLRISIEPAGEAFRKFRERVEEISVQTGYFKSKEEFQDFLHSVSMEYTRRKLRKAAQKRDQLAAQAIRAIDDLDKTYNLYVIRLREWYSVHFPELDNLVPNHEQYVRLVMELGLRENFNRENLLRLGIPQDKIEKIESAAKESIGADLSDFDIRPIQTLARMAWDTYTLREELSDYIESVMKEVAPNITALVGSLLGARLISLAGSLEALAKLPASTIQVLGAEKALFRSLKTGTRPPKHGIIFQYPEIHKAPRWQRGKMARTLAAKLAIAAKVDAFTGRWIGDKLVEDLTKRIEEIKKLYAKPPAKAPVQKEATQRPPRREERGGGRGGGKPRKKRFGGR